MSSALVLVAIQIQGTELSEWVCIVCAVLGTLLLRWAIPRRERFQQQQVERWPTVQGRIESVDVKEVKPSLISTWPRKVRPRYTSDVAYSYILEGHYYSGSVKMEFEDEEKDCKLFELARYLPDKPITVAYNPRNAAKSKLRIEALNAVLAAAPKHPVSS